MKKHVLFTAFVLSTLLSCKKDYEYCSNASVCVKNIGSTNIIYAWNSSYLEDTLRPGQITCTDAGEFNADPKNGAYSVVYFITNSSNRAIKSTSCYTVIELAN